MTAKAVLLPQKKVSPRTADCQNKNFIAIVIPGMQGEGGLNDILRFCFPGQRCLFLTHTPVRGQGGKCKCHTLLKHFKQSCTNYCLCSPSRMLSETLAISDTLYSDRGHQVPSSLSKLFIQNMSMISFVRLRTCICILLRDLLSLHSSQIRIGLNFK
jgi:hypothetical protein